MISKIPAIVVGAVLLDLRTAISSKMKYEKNMCMAAAAQKISDENLKLNKFALKNLLFGDDFNCRFRRSYTKLTQAT